MRDIVKLTKLHDATSFFLFFLGGGCLTHSLPHYNYSELHMFNFWFIRVVASTYYRPTSVSQNVSVIPFECLNFRHLQLFNSFLFIILQIWKSTWRKVSTSMNMVAFLFNTVTIQLTSQTIIWIATFFITHRSKKPTFAT